jgi:hypothetical protein
MAKDARPSIRSGEEVAHADYGVDHGHIGQEPRGEAPIYHALGGEVVCQRRPFAPIQAHETCENGGLSNRVHATGRELKGLQAEAQLPEPVAVIARRRHQHDLPPRVG